MTRFYPVVFLRRAALASLALLLWIDIPQPLGAQPMITAAPLSVAVTQGDEDYAIDVASRFLTGCEINCQEHPPASCQDARAVVDCSCQESVLHVPAAWCAVQLHLDAGIDYSRFYWDKAFTDPLVGNATLSTGQDDIAPQGLDGAYQVLFYAGEGNPGSFQARGATKYVGLERFSLGDGGVRYLFMLSCNLFAHGPRATHGAKDFSVPQSFDPLLVKSNKPFSDPDYEADVFNRWGKNYGGPQRFRSPLHPSLRLACGGSTKIGGNVANPTDLFWYYFSKMGLGPADAFLLGLYNPVIPTVPLCISRGDSYRASGLADATFVKKPLVDDPAGELPRSIYIEYPVPGDAQDPLVLALRSRSPHDEPQAEVEQEAEAPPLPVLDVRPALIPPFLVDALLVEPAFGPSVLKHTIVNSQLDEYGFYGGSAKALGIDLGVLNPFPPVFFRKDHLCVERHPGSGSLLFSWRPIVLKEDDGPIPPTTAEGLKAISNSLFARLLAKLPPAPETDGRPEIVPGDPIAIQMKIDGAPKEQSLPDESLRSQTISHEDGCLYVRQPLLYRKGGVEIPILGREILAKRCPSAALRDESFSPDPLSANDPCERTASPLFSLSYNAPVYHGERSGVHQKTRQEAEDEAWARLERVAPPRSAYEPEVVGHWGYKAAPAHCTQDEMFLVYRFDFQPKDKDRHTLTIEVPAHDLPTARIEDTWRCSPE